MSKPQPKRKPCPCCDGAKWFPSALGQIACQVCDGTGLGGIDLHWLVEDWRRLHARVVELEERATTVARWILTNRSKLTIGKSQADITEEHQTPLPVSLWMCAQELAGESARQIAKECDNAQRQKLNMPTT